MKNLKKMWGAVGTGLFWLLWPLWVVYFRFSSVRARVLVVCDEEVLLVQGWLSTKKWSLPGGGADRNEKTVSAAARELDEETGIRAPESNLTKLGSFKHTKYHFKYHGDLFVLSLNEKPELQVRKGEIWNVAWVPIDDVKQYKLDDEARSAIRRYQPPERPSLL
jgi:8-oxo-dGTP pyrophosphatase MutT (NUDIX family)